MTTITADPVAVATDRRAPGTAAPPGWRTALGTLARRRLALSVRTPRELVVPLLTPVLFAVVIAPALDDTFGAATGGLDYMTFVAVATIGLLVPLSCMSAGLGVLVDRIGGARPDLLAAPVARPLVVAANLVVALLLSLLQLVALLGFSALRGADYHVSVSGVAWFAGAALGFAALMYGVAEIMANRIPNQEEYVGALPAVAIVPWFFAGSLFPISALPVGLTAVAKALPITHVLALMRYGLAGDDGQALHDIWGMDSTTTMAAASLVVITAVAALVVALAVRTFTRTAVQ